MRKYKLIERTEEVTVNTLCRTLQRIATLPGIGNDTTNKSAIMACALLLGNIDTEDIVKRVTHAVSSNMERKIEELKATLELTTTSLRNDVSMAATQTITTYRDAVAKGGGAPVPFTKSTDIDPRTRAREAIRRRQVMVNITAERAEETIKTKAIAAIVGKANEAMKKIDKETNHLVRSARKLDNGGILLEASTEEAAGWITQNAEAFAKEFDEGASIKRRTYTIIARFVLMNFDPTSFAEHIELMETNNIPLEAIADMSWIKNPDLQAAGQKVAHLRIRFYDYDIANQLSVNGIYIHHEHITIERDKREPLRCYNCQGWDHLAATCVRAEYCGRCGAQHATRGCTSDKIYCTPCGTTGHVSGDRRSCPIFKRKMKELNERMPENAMPYWPTDEPWTHAAAPKATAPYSKRFNAPLTAFLRQGPKQRQKGRQPPEGRETSVAPPPTQLNANLTPIGSQAPSMEPSTQPSAHRGNYYA